MKEVRFFVRSVDTELQTIFNGRVTFTDSEFFRQTNIRLWGRARGNQVESLGEEAGNRICN